MPKISSDWLNPQSGDAKSNSGSTNIKSGDVFFRPEVGKPFVARILGDYVSFIAHWNRVDDGSVDEKGQIDWKTVDFPDVEERNHKPTRICTDDTPAKERYADIEGYLAKTKCPWCKLKYQGYKGEIRYAFNILLDLEGKRVCRIVEVPKTAMGMLKDLCSVKGMDKFVPKDGLGSVVNPVPVFKFNRPMKNDWKIELDFNVVEGLGLGNGVVTLTDADKEALKLINPKATYEEDFLKGHDLAKWYKKDYLAAELQKKVFGKILELSDYELNHGGGDVVEEFENEVDASDKPDEQDEPDVNIGETPETNEQEDEWGSLEDDKSSDTNDDEDPLW